MIKIRIMGKLKFFGLLIAAGMFAACSDNLENAGYPDRRKRLC